MPCPECVQPRFRPLDSLTAGPPPASPRTHRWLLWGYLVLLLASHFYRLLEPKVHPPAPEAPESIAKHATWSLGSFSIVTPIDMDFDFGQPAASDPP